LAGVYTETRTVHDVKVHIYIYIYIYIYISRYIVYSGALYVEESILGKKLGVEQSNSGEKTERECWLCDKYGYLARNCRLRNIRLNRSYQDADRMYRVYRRLEPRNELLRECTRVYGAVTCRIAKLSRSIIIACETEEKVRIQQKDAGQWISWGGGGGVHKCPYQSHM